MHRDIKPENILLKKEAGGRRVAALADFGLSKQESQQSNEIAGSNGYIPPEVLRGSKHQGKGDVFSLGVMGESM